MESLLSILKILVGSEAIEQEVLNMYQKKIKIYFEKKITCEDFSGLMNATLNSVATRTLRPLNLPRKTKEQTSSS